MKWTNPAGRERKKKRETERFVVHLNASKLTPNITKMRVHLIGRE